MERGDRGQQGPAQHTRACAGAASLPRKRSGTVSSGAGSREPVLTWLQGGERLCTAGSRVGAQRLLGHAAETLQRWAAWPTVYGRSGCAGTRDSVSALGLVQHR